MIDWFAELPGGPARLGVVRKIMMGADVHACLDRGIDAVLIGRAAMLHHDYPRRIAANPDFVGIAPGEPRA